jgi:L-methionine (R)-S-oxide reductase
MGQTRYMTQPIIKETLVARVREVLVEQKVEEAARFQLALQAIADAFDAQTATLHRAVLTIPELSLVAHLGLPSHLIEITRHIPFGKGIAGLCAQEQRPISLCNLQTDTSGAVRPLAKQTGVEGAISVPVFDPSSALIGTLGVGKRAAHTYSDEELAVLVACAVQLGAALRDYVA